MLKGGCMYAATTDGTEISLAQSLCPGPEGDNEIYPTDTWIPKAVSMIHNPSL